ncbi:MAG: ribonuclease P protein component [Propionibacteriaceae bacterium]|jgi:ribonuclease P protein component|nr:ribonuclease P protein component [Propionibacteriaceae bacterium]
MLPVSARLRHAAQFAATVRGGRQTGRPSLILYVRTTAGERSRAGFVVSKQVGSAVQRNRVKRRLRHLVASRLDDLPQTADIVIRALPKASRQASRLRGDFESAWAWAAGQCGAEGPHRVAAAPSQAGAAAPRPTGSTAVAGRERRP